MMVHVSAGPSGAGRRSRGLRGLLLARMVATVMIHTAVLAPHYWLSPSFVIHEHQMLFCTIYIAVAKGRLFLRAADTLKVLEANVHPEAEATAYDPNDCQYTGGGAWNAAMQWRWPAHRPAGSVRRSAGSSSPAVIRDEPNSALSS